MRRLFATAFRKHTHRVLIGISLVLMCLLTFASQLEIFSLGVLTNQGPDFFELFAPRKENTLLKSDTITREGLLARWEELDPGQTGIVTKDDTVRFLKSQNTTSIIGALTKKIDRVIPITTSVRNLAIMLFVIALFKALTLFSHRYLTRVIAIQVSRDLRQDYFKHIQSLPMEFYQRQNIGGLSSRVLGDAQLIAEAINSCMVNYFQTPFLIVSTLTLCFLTSWQLSLITFFGFPLIVFPISYLARGVKRISRQIQKNQERFASVLVDFIAGIQTVKVFAMEDFSLRKYKEQNDMMASLEQRSARYDLSTRPVVHSIGMLFLATTLLVGLYGLQMRVADLFFYCGLLYVFYEPVKKFAEENSRIQRGVAAADRMFEVMELNPQIEDRMGAVPLKEFEGPIEFFHVWFRYDDEWVLKDLSFTVKKGETVAIVGPTGAGKSTIVQLLPRLYDVQKGEIRINGKPLDTYTQRSLREQIAFVPQKPFLFLDTISENISFGRKFVPEDIYEAAKRAHAHEFIQCLPNGYTTELAEAGKNLSGGQQQRLAIARALVKGAPILVMDEATSSLDNVSENHIKTAIKNLRGQMTQIIIAHRLTTIEDADKIIYLQDGQKIAEGTKDELLQTCSGFKLMWQAMHQSKKSEVC